MYLNRKKKGYVYQKAKVEIHFELNETDLHDNFALWSFNKQPYFKKKYNSSQETQKIINMKIFALDYLQSGNKSNTNGKTFGQKTQLTHYCENIL